MYFGLLLMLIGAFLIIWGLHYFGFLTAATGGTDGQKAT